MRHLKRGQTVNLIPLLMTFTACVCIDTVRAETLSEGQDALRRAQFNFYQAVKAQPKASPAELARLRDATQQPGAAAWARGVGSAMQSAVKTRAKKSQTSGSVPSTATPPASVSPTRTNRDFTTSSSDQPGISGSDVPGMLQFPGKIPK